MSGNKFKNTYLKIIRLFLIVALFLPSALSGQTENISDKTATNTEEAEIPKENASEEIYEKPESPKDEAKQPERKNAADKPGNVTDNVKENNPVNDKSGPDNAVAEKNSPDQDANKVPEAPVTKPSFQNTSRYIEIGEGNFKYERIPGITLKKRVYSKITTEEKAEAGDKEALNDKAGNENKENNEKEKESSGLFGRFSDIVKVIVIIVIMIIIFLIIRLRSKGRTGKVLRRFPGS